MTKAYPLAWPELFPRSQRRTSSQFKTGLSGALKNVRGALDAFGRDSGKKVEEVVISSNVSLGEERPKDPGVAVWFRWDGLQVCIPVDRYEKPEDNLQAIYHVLEARRTELRHGTLAIVRATMTGFAALPPPPGKRGWREILGLPPGPHSAHDVVEMHRRLSVVRHPDKPGGSNEAMAELNAARDAALKEIGQ